ncbi:MAG: hypothetical protein LBH59_04770, partial [Planctomycetaceae bacterium]|nr:hypothetical protein [Planctomycetaceae bacterium]
MYTFSRITIIGIGAIGGSVGLAAKVRNIAQSIIGIDSDEKALEEALRLGAIDYGAANLDEGINNFVKPIFPDKPDNNIIERYKPEIVIIATPVSSVGQYVNDVANVVQNT